VLGGAGVGWEGGGLFVEGWLGAGVVGGLVGCIMPVYGDLAVCVETKSTVRAEHGLFEE